MVIYSEWRNFQNKGLYKTGELLDQRTRELYKTGELFYRTKI